MAEVDEEARTGAQLMRRVRLMARRGAGGRG